MEGKGEKDEETSPLQIDPKCIQDALKVLFQPVKNDDARLEFYAVYQKVATKYDADYTKTRNVDLNVMLILAGLLSAVSTAFIIDVNSKVDPPAENPSTPPVLPYSILLAAWSMRVSLGFSLMATFLAMMEKERLNRDLLPMGGSMIQRCRYRQRKLDRHRRFRLWLSVASPRFIKGALFFLACGLCARTVYTYRLPGLITGAIPLLAILAYFHIAYFTHRSGPLSRARVLVALRWQWPGWETPYHVWDVVLRQIRQVLLWLPSVEIDRRSRNQSLPTVQPAPQNPIPSPASRGISPDHTVTPVPPDHISSPTIRGSVTAFPWLTPKARALLQETNGDDAKCVLWVLRWITDPEALNAAIRFATVIRWHEDGLGVEKTRGLVVSFLEECFDFNGIVSPEFRDRAYYSIQAVVWIDACRECAPERFAGFGPFPTPVIPEDTTCLDRDLRNVLGIYSTPGAHGPLTQMYHVGLGFTLADIQWASSALLHMSWARRDVPEAFRSITKEHTWGDWSTIPLNAVFNRLLAWCVFLGWRVDMDALRVEAKSHRSEQIVYHLSQAITSAIRTSHPRCDLLLDMLVDLAGWEQRPSCLTTMAYGWCSVIFENPSRLADGTRLLSLSFQIAFCRLDPQHPQIPTTEYHQRMVDFVFESGDEEAIAGLLHAWTCHSNSHQPSPSLGMCAGHLIGPHYSSQRLRRLVIRSIELIEPQEFEGIGVAEFCRSLDHLCVGVEDVDREDRWSNLLMCIIQRPEGVRCLSHPYWELLVASSLSGSLQSGGVTWNPDITVNLEDSQEWGKLECWMGIVWMLWPPETGVTTEADLGRVSVSLFRRRPGSVRKLGRGWWTNGGKHALMVCLSPFDEFAIGRVANGAAGWTIRSNWHRRRN